MAVPNRSRRPGSTSKPAHKKGASKGTGGLGRKALQGRGPTPRAEDRTYHAAHARKKQQEQREAQAAKAQQVKEKRSAHIPHIPDTHQFVVGRNPVIEAVKVDMPVVRVFATAEVIKDDRLARAVQRATKRGAPLIECNRLELDRLTDGATHQGIAIQVPPYEYSHTRDLWRRAQDRIEWAQAELEEAAELAASTTPEGDTASTVSAKSSAPAPTRPPLFVALDHLQDPHNLGAVVRSAAAFGADGILLPERRSAPVSPAVWKVSAGALAHIPIAQVTNLVSELKWLKAQGCFVVGLDAGGTTPLRGLHLADVPLVVVVGAEGQGLSRLVRDTCDEIVSIPIAPEVESLNASVATAVTLYEIAQLRSSN
ncbi:MAG: 23S rRNA (guanosine(2251)-2'-O)-methyltransferase RlmB [Actinomycetaceae bacterium]|nr:23S rRNA (guanosine(2251)-2'-O)-methyltransferase RlmB [Actinomycetaceae bacterium]